MNHLAEEIAKRLRSVLGDKALPLHEPTLDTRDAESVARCVNSGYVSSVGAYVNEFEKKLAEYTGARYAIATVNGTSALHIALLIAGVERNDEVIMPAMTFVGTANAASYIGAVPHFVDVETNQFGLCPDALRDHLEHICETSKSFTINRHTGRKVKAIVPMHTFGHPCDMDKILDLADHYNIPVVEDAAEALGSKYRGAHTGTLGLAGILSFNGNKIITTGGGGAILTNDEDIARKAKHLSSTAKIGDHWQASHDEIGFNYRMPNLNAALGCAQLDKLDTLLSSKRRLSSLYQNAFEGLSDVSYTVEPAGCFSNYWLQTLKLKTSSEPELGKFVTELATRGLHCRPVWKPLHQLRPYRQMPRSDLKNTELLSNQLLNIPSSAGLV